MPFRRDSGPADHLTGQPRVLQILPSPLPTRPPSHFPGSGPPTYSPALLCHQTSSGLTITTPQDLLFFHLGTATIPPAIEGYPAHYPHTCPPGRTSLQDPCTRFGKDPYHQDHWAPHTADAHQDLSQVEFCLPPHTLPGRRFSTFLTPDPGRDQPLPLCPHWEFGDFLPAPQGPRLWESLPRDHWDHHFSHLCPILCQHLTTHPLPMPPTALLLRRDHTTLLWDTGWDLHPPTCCLTCTYLSASPLGFGTCTLHSHTTLPGGWDSRAQRTLPCLSPTSPHSPGSQEDPTLLPRWDTSCSQEHLLPPAPHLGTGISCLTYGFAAPSGRKDCHPSLGPTTAYTHCLLSPSPQVLGFRSSHCTPHTTPFTAHTFPACTCTFVSLLRGRGTSHTRLKTSADGRTKDPG